MLIISSNGYLSPQHPADQTGQRLRKERSAAFGVGDNAPSEATSSKVDQGLSSAPVSDMDPERRVGSTNNELRIIDANKLKTTNPSHARGLVLDSSKGVS